MIMYTKKKATAADEVFFLPNDNKIEAIIMQMPRPKQPYSMVLRRPMRSRASAGPRLPTMNMSWILYAVSTERGTEGECVCGEGER